MRYWEATYIATYGKQWITIEKYMSGSSLTCRWEKQCNAREVWKGKCRAWLLCRGCDSDTGQCNTMEGKCRAGLSQECRGCWVSWHWVMQYKGSVEVAASLDTEQTHGPPPPSPLHQGLSAHSCLLSSIALHSYSLHCTILYCNTWHCIALHCPTITIAPGLNGHSILLCSIVIHSIALCIASPFPIALLELERV